MQGDFSRVPFAPGDNITRVLLQQGRPLVEADLNEALMALLMEQRELVRLHYPTNHGPIDTAFQIASDADQKLRVLSGSYRFESVFARKPLDSSAQSYIKVNDRFIVDFVSTDHLLPTHDDLKEKSFVVGLTVAERPLLLSEIGERAPSIQNLRSGIPWRIHWEIFLESFTTDADTKRQEIINRNPFAFRKSLGVKAGKRETLGRELENCLWRLEVHKVVPGNEPEVELKLAINNAADLFEARKISSGNVRITPYAGQLPKKESYVEVESKLSWFNGPGTLYRISELREHRDGVIASTTSIAGEIVDDSAQLRVWNWVKTIKVADLIKPEGVELGPLKVHFDSLNAYVATARLRSGDGWTFSTRQLADIGNIATAKVVLGTRQPVYYQALGTATFADDGKVTVNRETYRTTLATIGTAGEGSIARSVLERRPITPVGDVAQTHANSPKFPQVDIALAEALSCQRLFPDVENPAMRRWLASATLGEIPGNKEQLRQRIQNDCQATEINPSTLESDLDLVIAKRQQLLPSQRSIYA